MVSMFLMAPIVPFDSYGVYVPSTLPLGQTTVYTLASGHQYDIHLLPGVQTHTSSPHSDSNHLPRSSNCITLVISGWVYRYRLHEINTALIHTPQANRLRAPIAQRLP